jgi:AraC-like DNA-binding protein
MLQSAVQSFTERCLIARNRSHDVIVKKFEELLDEYPDRPLSVPEICAAIGVCERTLRKACEEHFGMGPIRYLTLRRMHRVRQSLLRADASKTNVTRILTDHCFWELGRFSVAYRALFGETPSQTLRRPAEQRRGGVPARYCCFGVDRGSPGTQ